jgi:hypothetical protein
MLGTEPRLAGATARRAGLDFDTAWAGGRLLASEGDFSHGGGLARESVTAQLRWSVQMLDSRCPEAVRRELHTAVADLAGVAAWMSFDGLARNVHGGCSGLRRLLG